MLNNLPYKYALNKIEYQKFKLECLFGEENNYIIITAVKLQLAIFYIF